MGTSLPISEDQMGVDNWCRERVAIVAFLINDIQVVPQASSVRVCLEYSNYYITVTMVIYLLSDSHWGCIYGGEWVEDVRVHAVSVCW